MKSRTIRPLRIPAYTAAALREKLCSDDDLSPDDVKALLKILDDVYPRPHPRPAWVWVLAGMGIMIVIFLFIIGGLTL